VDKVRLIYTLKGEFEGIPDNDLGDIENTVQRMVSEGVSDESIDAMIKHKMQELRNKHRKTNNGQ